MWNSNVEYARAYASERMNVLAEHADPLKAHKQHRKPVRLWRRFLSLWL